MAFDLNRFLEAQDGGGYDAALAELRAGRKRSHWIWYILPQLRGMGSSSYAVRYGLEGVEEAEAYLRHPVLRERLVQIVEAIHAQVQDHQPRLESLMGSHIDAVKLVSSMTLFERVARDLEGEDPSLGSLARMASDILQAADAQGYPRCSFTSRHLES